MQVETPFLEASRLVVKAFLNSVVLVDDQANLGPRIEESTPTKVVKPGRQGATHTKIAGVGTVNLPSAIAEPDASATVGNEAPKTASVSDSEVMAPAKPSQRSHSLDAKTVTDVFAKIGVVCAVLRPETAELETLGDLVMQVGTNADVLILDWVLCDSKLGERTLALIKRIVESAAESGRARLILIYTAEADLITIEKDIRKTLGLVEVTPRDSLTVSSAGTRICVYGKAGTLTTPIGDSRIKTPEELPAVVVSEFTEMTKGLLSNVAMKSIAAIRAKTFQLLRRFDCDMDAPYVTQSALISPERAEEQLTSLIVSEIQEILEDENVGSLADYDYVIRWLDDRMKNGLTLPATATMTSEQYYAGLIQLVKDGVGPDAAAKLKQDHAQFAGQLIPGNKDKARLSVRDALTGVLRSNPSAAHQADEMLTMLMSLRHRYTNPAPQLALGTIVSRTDQAGQTYLLCLQPVCDSVRIKGSRPFAFLLLKAAANSKNCELIVNDGGELRFLTVKPSPFMVEMISFNSNQNEKVMATNSQNDGFVFGSSENIVFKWIADLKPAHAQRIANKFAYAFSRVGLVESEWNRLGSNLGS
jgi:Response receiver domain